MMKHLSKWIYVMSILLISASCGDDNAFTPRKPEYQTFSNKSAFDNGIGSYSDKPGDARIPYPKIIHNTYIPDYDLWADTRCQAWRIEWPDYAATVSDDAIPTAFSTNNGALNSFDYLNSVNPATTHNAQFSLYYDGKLLNIGSMWAELNHSDAALNDYVKFLKKDYDLSTIKHMVTERPSLFESYWEPSNDIEVSYGEGDFFMWKNEDQGRYGGIRIVSMSPMIIEVYKAEPNI